MPYYTWTDPTTNVDYIVNDGGPIADFFTEDSPQWSAYQAWLAEGNKAQLWV